MLDAHPDCKGLALQRHARLLEHLERVSGGVAGGQHQRVTAQRVPPRRSLDLEARQPVAYVLQARQTVAEPDLTAQLQQLQPQAFDHLA